jgi:hypothetical protein
MAAGGGQPVRRGTAYPQLGSLMDASAPAPSRATIASKRPYLAAKYSGVPLRLRATAALAAALAHADPRRPAAQKAPPAEAYDTVLA